jgi:hypothetical protein
MPVSDLLKRVEEGLMLEEANKLPVYLIGNVEITAKEARELVAEHPDHPAARDLDLAVGNLADDYKVNVDKATIYGIHHNKKVVEKVVVQNGEVRRIRVLSDDAPDPADETTTTYPMMARGIVDPKIRAATAAKERAAGMAVRDVTGKVVEQPGQLQTLDSTTTTLVESAADYAARMAAEDSTTTTEQQASATQSQDLQSRPASSVEPFGKSTAKKR